MASKAPVRSLQAFCRTQMRCCRCNESTRPISRAVRRFSTIPSRLEEQTSEHPRWSYTPPQMKAPFHPRKKNPLKAWEYKEDPAAVDDMYIGLLGRNGDKVLSDEVKWLAITHKSYDQGRRGFNDRLAFFGKRIVLLQTSLALLNSPSTRTTSDLREDEFGRTIFQHPALSGLSNVSTRAVNDLLTKERTSQIAESYGIGAVTRWKPKNPMNLAGSGYHVVFSTSLYAIIGAVALQKGGEAAAELTRARILGQISIGENRGH